MLSRTSAGGTVAQLRQVETPGEQTAGPPSSPVATRCRLCPEERPCMCLGRQTNNRWMLTTVALLMAVSTVLLLHHHCLLHSRFPLTPSSAPVPPSGNISVLLWHWPYGRSYPLDGDPCRERYNIGRCLLSDDRSAFAAADVVVFHHHELAVGRSSLPAANLLPRPAAQRWVWMSLEPPAHNRNLSAFNHLFNWTMSYRLDADIHVPYGRTEQGGGEPGPATAPSRNRSCLASWVVTQYRPTQARAGIYQSLKRHVPIEGYGRWFRKPLSKRRLLPTIGRCLFYLAFENSQATDYISEKLWRNSFQAGAVPVVLGPGRATYEALAPPHSFIHVDDFSGTAELAAYLKSLASNRSAYEAYLDWHRTHNIKVYTDWRERLCQICVKYFRLQANKVYHDLESWVNQ